MADENNIISGFLSQAAQQPKGDFAKRRAAKAARILARTNALLAGVLQMRREVYTDFWTGTDSVSPKAVAAELGPEKTASLFQEDMALVEFLAGRLKNAGATDEQIAQLLPGVPDEYTVTADETGVHIDDKV